MMWSRRVDYHGSRSYERDAPAIGRFELLGLWLASIAKAKLRGLRKRFGSGPSSTASAVAEHLRFSRLGASDASNPHHQAADSPFPRKD